MALDPWNNASDEPARLAHLDDRNDRAVLLQGSEGPAQVVELLCHGTLHRVASSDDGDIFATVCPIASQARPSGPCRTACPSRSQARPSGPCRTTCPSRSSPRSWRCLPARPGRDASAIVLGLDSAGWHTEPNLVVPDGIRLAYLPPYSPELQPAEHLWPVLDEPLANQSFETLADLERAVAERCLVL